MNGILSFMYFDSYLGIGDKFAQIFAPAIIVSIIFNPVWLWVINRFGKYRAMTMAFLVYALMTPLPFLVMPGEGAFIPMLIYYCTVSSFTPLIMITMPTILGDVIDFDEVQSGKNRSGQYNAFLTLAAKASVAIGGPIAIMLVGFFGYQPGIENTPDAIKALRLVYNFVPVPFILCGVYCFWKFPITDKNQPALAQALRERFSRDAEFAEDCLNDKQG